jgi:exodeoxyribonuclease VII small subunit
MEEKKIDEMSFEEAYTALEETLNSMEKQDIPLEESMKLFKKGVALYRRCKVLIDSASLSVKEVLGDLEKEMEENDDLGR